MKTFSHSRILILACFAAVTASSAIDAYAQVISLDGTWQLAEGTVDQRPERFDRTVPVPGLVDQSVPSFDPQRFADRKDAAGPPGAVAVQDRSFWYRREFEIAGEVPAVASLLVRKAAYGSTVYLNGTQVGESQASFTANRYDVRASLRGHGATNELVVRVGASRESLPRTVPRGQDYEKIRYVPGLFDSVQLELSGTPHFIHVQTAPDIANQQVRVQARIHNAGPRSGGDVEVRGAGGKIGQRCRTTGGGLSAVDCRSGDHH